MYLMYVSFWWYRAYYFIFIFHYSIPLMLLFQTITMIYHEIILILWFFVLFSSLFPNFLSLSPNLVPVHPLYLLHFPLHKFMSDLSSVLQGHQYYLIHPNLIAYLGSKAKYRWTPLNVISYVQGGGGKKGRLRFSISGKKSLKKEERKVTKIKWKNKMKQRLFKYRNVF